MPQTSEQAKAWYRSNRTARLKAVARNVRNHRERRAEVIAKFKDGPCKDCGKRFHHSAMDFDHLPGSQKVGSIHRLIQNGLSLERISIEIAKCELVCANCHRVRTWNRAHPSVV